MLSKVLALGHNQGFLKYFKNASWMMVEQFLRIIAGLFVGIWVARYLGPEQFGIFSYVFAFTAIFAGIAKLGLDEIIVRELVNEPEKNDIYLGTAFWLKFTGAFFVMAIIVTIIPFTNNDFKTNLFIFIIASSLFFQSFEVIEFYFYSKVLAKLTSTCKVIQLVISSCLKIYLVLTQADLIWFVLVSVFDSLSLAVSYYIAYKVKNESVFFKNFDFNIAKLFLKDSWPLIFSAIVVMVYMRIDQIMIGKMLGEYEVGIYSVAVRLSEVFYFIPSLVSASIFPAILNAKKQGEEQYKKRLQQLYTFMVWLAVSIAIPMSFLANWLVILLFGNDYSEAGDILRIHIWAAVFVFLGIASSRYLLTENLTKISFLRTLLGAIGNVIFNLWLIPIYGMVGAAIGTLLSQFLANFAYDIIDKRLHGQLTMKTKSIIMPWKSFLS